MLLTVRDESHPVLLTLEQVLGKIESAAVEPLGDVCNTLGHVHHLRRSRLGERIKTADYVTRITDKFSCLHDYMLACSELLQTCFLVHIIICT